MNTFAIIIAIIGIPLGLYTMYLCLLEITGKSDWQILAKKSDDLYVQLDEIDRKLWDKEYERYEKNIKERKALKQERVIISKLARKAGRDYMDFVEQSDPKGYAERKSIIDSLNL